MEVWSQAKLHKREVCYWAFYLLLFSTLLLLDLDYIAGPLLQDNQSISHQLAGILALFGVFTLWDYVLRNFYRIIFRYFWPLPSIIGDEPE
jgi:hypothetical protein